MYAVAVGPRAKREIGKLDKSTQRRVMRALDKLKEEPRPKGVEKLSQDRRFWRLKVGDHRVIYAIIDDERIVVALVVRHRREVYRDVQRLGALLERIDLESLVSGARLNDPD